MTMMRKLLQVEVSPVGDDEVEVIISTAALARDGHILEPGGCITENYQRNPIWLWSHDTNVPTGNADSIIVGEDSIRCRVRFAPRGISPRADEINGLVKTGVIRAASIAFDPLECEPLDPKKPKGGQRITKWDWLESSWVSVPSDTNALVTARTHGEDEMPDTPEDAPESKPATRSQNRAVRSNRITFKRGLYQVANLCTLMVDLGWQVDMATWEAAYEGDGSKVPAMLAAAFSDLGDALLAMTAEEVAEALAGFDIEMAEDVETDVILVAEERAHIAAATSPGVRAFRRAMAHANIRAGKTLSAETVRCLREAKALHDDAMDMHRGAMRKHKDGVAAIDDLLSGAGATEAEAEDTGARSAEPGIPIIIEANELPPEDGLRSAADFRRRQADLLEFESR